MLVLSLDIQTQAKLIKSLIKELQLLTIPCMSHLMNLSLSNFLINDDVDMKKGEKDLEPDKPLKEKQDDHPRTNDENQEKQ